MPENVLPNLFRIEAPLPNNPLRAINAYVVLSDERNLVVDTGMNQPECREALEKGLAALAVDRTRTDFFITHFHADHLGLTSAFATDTSRVYFNEPEARWTRRFKAADFIAGMLRRARTCGFPDDRLAHSLQSHPGIKYGPLQYPEFTVLRDGDVLTVGDYRFRCIETPGHSPGHLCLYEPDQRLLFSGDHVLGDITPNISGMLDDTDMLALYMASLDKIYDLDVTMTLPGHRRAIRDLQRRIRELKAHHREREQEVAGILKTGPVTAYETAARMTWDIAADSWEQFPIMQQWFAVGEAMAHLIHLQQKGEAQKTTVEGAVVYTAV